MNNDQRIAEEVEKTLHVLGQMKNLEPNPFMYTRINAELTAMTARKGLRVTVRNAALPALLALILLMNIITAVSFFEPASAGNINESLITAMRDDYQIVLTQDELMTGD